jgi:hypothetical protein
LISRYAITAFNDTQRLRGSAHYAERLQSASNLLDWSSIHRPFGAFHGLTTDENLLPETPLILEAARE